MSGPSGTGHDTAGWVGLQRPTRVAHVPADPPVAVPGPASVSPAERHPATEKVWAWFETDERALSFTPTLRAAISARIASIDADLLAWEAEDTLAR